MKKVIFKPIGKNIFVLPDKEDSRESKSGLITPSNVEQEKKSSGVVLDVGGEVKVIKKGDRIVYGMFAGDPLKIDNIEYKVVAEEFVLGIL